MNLPIDCRICDCRVENAIGLFETFTFKATCYLQAYADCVGFTSQHVHQRVEEHKRSVIGDYIREQHENEPCEIAKSVRVPRIQSARTSAIV